MPFIVLVDGFERCLDHLSPIESLPKQRLEFHAFRTSTSVFSGLCLPLMAIRLHELAHLRGSVEIPESAPCMRTPQDSYLTSFITNLSAFIHSDKQTFIALAKPSPYHAPMRSTKSGNASFLMRISLSKALPYSHRLNQGNILER